MSAKRGWEGCIGQCALRRFEALGPLALELLPLGEGTTSNVESVPLARGAAGA